VVALRGQWLGPHPVTGVDGVWFQKQDGSVVGMSKPDMQALPTGSGNAAQRRATFITNLQNALNAQLGPGFTLTIDVSAGAPYGLDQIEIRDA
jgi:hypothetical protein